MVDGTEPAEKVTQVNIPTSEAKSQTQGLETRLSSLEREVIRLSEDFQTLTPLRTELDNAATSMWGAAQAFQSAESRLATLERKTQRLSDEPIQRNCRKCGARIDQRANRCPKCSEPAGS